MRPSGTIHVHPALPASLEPLRTLAYNLRWSWNGAARELFRRLDLELWEVSGHNPVQLLASVSERRLLQAAADVGFMSHLRGVLESLDDYMKGETTWYRGAHGTPDSPVYAYFCMEFGLTDCMPIFAGGLGVLAGDHMKSVSDLGVPLVGVGLLYQQGYFRQYLYDAGWQGEIYTDNDFDRLPITMLRDEKGAPLRVGVPLPGRTLQVQAWQAQVGRAPLLLLDTNLSENGVVDRDITDQLYGGEPELRLQQELVLGIGGMRVLRALGVRPLAYHLNEGHSAFLGLEHIRNLRTEHALSFAEAHELARASLIFTSHTPVDAGHDRFPVELARHYLAGYSGELGIPIDALIALGHEPDAPPSAPFNMSMLALRLAARVNAVSDLHGRVTRTMWRGLWPELPVAEVPIRGVSNGVHFPSWVSRELDQLYDRYLGTGWRESSAGGELWQRARTIPAEELWRVHCLRRERLVSFARRHLCRHLRRRHAPEAELAPAGEALDPDTLTIGFARRFAQYKRATLLLRDRDRLAALLQSEQGRVQLIFAGKAHPRDHAGKELIQQLVALSREPPYRGRIVFLEDYDLAVARYLVQGCDVWLNTPRRPREASGTSGMKAAVNGVLNVSTLDGWWADAWAQLGADQLTPGWSVGSGEEGADGEEQDAIEATALYHLLERTIVPEFYDRGRDDLPRRWIRRMQESIAVLGPRFNSHRMVCDYVTGYYRPAAAQYQAMLEEGAAEARSLAAWRERIRATWRGVRIEQVESATAGEIATGEQLEVRALVRLDGITPSDVMVQLSTGRIDADGLLVDAVNSLMTLEAPEPAESGSLYRYRGAQVMSESGKVGYTVRVLPTHPALVPALVGGFVTWAG